jgi:8-oxo-dGTP pyrophosphatase MutT (NUDIX family)
MKTAVVNRIINEKGETLFLLRAKNPFGWCLAGGKVDAEDTSKKAACVRETMEETGIDIDIDDLTYVGEVVSVNGTPITVYETVLDHTPDIKINRAEHMNKRWIKTHSTEYAGSFTDEVRGLAFAGKTLQFIDLGRGVFIPGHTNR